MSTEHEGRFIGVPAATAPWQVRAAGAIVGLQGLSLLAIAVVFTLRALRDRGPISGAIILVSFIFLVGIWLLDVGRSMVRPRPRESPARVRSRVVMSQLLAAPLVLGLVRAPSMVLPAVAVALLVVACVALILSEPARAWSRAWAEQ